MTASVSCTGAEAGPAASAEVATVPASGAALRLVAKNAPAAADNTHAPATSATARRLFNMG
jgi:hypothetical protein